MRRKSIAKNSIFNVLYKGFTALFPLLTTTYISRVLLADGVGKVAYAQTVVTYFATTASLGLPNYGVKSIAQCGENIQERSRRFSELFVINTISTLFCMCVYFIFINNTHYFSGRTVLFNVMGLMLVLNIINIDWFYQGIEEYGYIATRSIIVKIVSFVAMLIFVKEYDDYIKYALILCVATAGNYIFNAIHIRKYIEIRRYKLNVKKHLKPVLILLASALATEVYTMLDTIMLEYFHGETYVGYYSNSVKIVRMIYTVITAMVATFYPRVSLYLKERKIEESNSLLTLGTKIILLVAIPSVIGLICISDGLVYILFGKSFALAIDTLRILCILVLVFSIAYLLGHVVLMSSGKEKYILKATIVGAVVNFCANIIFIPIFKHNGAAFASVIAEIMVTSLLLAKSMKIIKISLNRKYIISLMISNGILVIIVCSINILIKSIYIRLFVSVVIGGVAYIGSLLLTHNELLTDVLKILKIKVLGKEENASY